jgi:hypothetical protein
MLALTQAIIADGVARETAEYAVTRWLLTKDSIKECVRLETESPAPPRHQHARDLQAQA